MTPLHLACLSGNSNTVNAIINFLNGKEIESDFLSMKSATGMNAFHYACLNWNSEVLLTLLQSGKYDNFSEHENCEELIKSRRKFYKKDLNADGDDNIKPLHVAVMTGCLKNVELILNYRQQALQAEQQHLLQIRQIEEAQTIQKVQQYQAQSQLSKASSSDQNYQNMTLFIQKVYAKKSKKILLNLPKPNKQPQQQQSIDQNEIEQSSKQIQILEKQKKEKDDDFLNRQLLFRRRNHELSSYSYIVNSATKKMNKTPLILAVQYGDLDIVSFLVKHKQINLNLRDIIGRSALHFACFYGFSEIVKVLLHKKGTVLNEPSCEGMTPLHYAAMKDHREVTSLLLKNQVNGQLDDRNRKFFVDVNVRTPWTLETPLHLAKSADVVTVLIEEGQNIDLNATDRDGMTSLHIACKEMNLDVAKVLLKRAGSDVAPDNMSVIDVNLKDKSGKTALHYACLNSDIEIAKALMQVNGIKINMVDNDGLSPIKAACFNPDRNLIDLFLSRSDLVLDEKDKEIVDKAKEIKI